MATSLEPQCLEGGAGDLQSKLPSKTSSISEFWVQQRDLVSKNKVESNKGKLQISLEPLHAHANTLTHLCTHVREHTYHIYIHAMLKKNLNTPFL